MSSFSLLLFYPDNFNLDGDNTLDAKDAAHSVVTETIGPFLVGFTISAAYVLLSGAEFSFPLLSVARLFGVSCAQSFLYFRRYSQDNVWLKFIVSNVSASLYDAYTAVGYCIIVMKSHISSQ